MNIHQCRVKCVDMMVLVHGEEVQDVLLIPGVLVSSYSQEYSVGYHSVAMDVMIHKLYVPDALMLKLESMPIVVEYKQIHYSADCC